MKCSVVILNWNGAQMLQHYLPSVVQYTSLDDCEIVVADNGSTDNSIAILSNFPTVRVIRLEQNYGFAEGYNRALAQVSSTYSILLNSDVEVKGDWLSPLLTFMDEHANVAAIQPKIHSVQFPHRFEHAGAAGGKRNWLGYPYCRGRRFGKVERDYGQYDTMEEIDWASGACLCTRTQLYKDLGGLDAKFFAHMEEIDLCWRMQTAGYKIYCIPTSTVYHLGGGSLPYGNPRKTYLNFRNNHLMLYKNLNTFQWLIIYSIRLLLDGATMLYFLLRNQREDAKAIRQAHRDFLAMKKEY